MDSSNVFHRLADYRIVTVIAIENANSALSLADALIEGGLPVAEITFRTSAAGDVITRLKKERPDLLLGAGTVLTEDQARRAKDCGASFAVAPGLNPRVVETARKIGLPFAPGVMTPSDVETALAMGLDVLKFFPAGAAGGPTFLKSLSAPYAHTGVRFIPTGGVNVRNMTAYLELLQVLAVGGTWIANKADIAAGNWETVRMHCREAAAALPGD